MEERDLADSQASVEEREAWQDEPQSAPSQVVMSLSDDAKDFLNSLVQSLSDGVAQSAQDVEDRAEDDENETEVEPDSADDGTDGEATTEVEPDEEERSKEDSQEIEIRSKEEQELVDFFA